MQPGPEPTPIPRSRHPERGDDTLSKTETSGARRYPERGAGINQTNLPNVTTKTTQTPGLNPSEGRHLRRDSQPRYSSRLDIIRAVDMLINIILVGSPCTTSPYLSPSESCANHVTKLVDLSTASYSRLSILQDLHSGTQYIPCRLIRRTAFVSVTNRAIVCIRTTALQAMILAMDVMQGACTG